MLILSERVEALFKALKNAAPTIMQLHAYRYSHFVRYSDRGEQCGYALATLREFHSSNEEEEIRSMIEEIRSLCSSVECQLDQVCKSGDSNV